MPIATHIQLAEQLLDVQDQLAELHECRRSLKRKIIEMMKERELKSYKNEHLTMTLEHLEWCSWDGPGVLDRLVVKRTK